MTMRPIIPSGMGGRPRMSARVGGRSSSWTCGEESHPADRVDLVGSRSGSIDRDASIGRMARLARHQPPQANLAEAAVLLVWGT